MKTIRVTGKGRIKVHPDMTRIVITLRDRCKEYSETLRRSAEDTEQLRDTLSELGFGRSDLKTLRFMRNAILASRGYVFRSKDLKAYFESQPWYQPAIDNADVDLSLLDLINIALIQAAERQE